MDLTGKIAQCNGRLKAANVAIRIEQRGNRLLLRGTLPPKPTSTKSSPHQQRLSPNLPANPAGLREAEKLARLISAQMATGEFSWVPWQRSGSTPQSCEDWIEKFEQHYLGNGGSTATWAGDYLKIFKLLPPTANLDVSVLVGVIAKTAPNTKTRQRACMALGALAKFAGLEFDPTPYRGKYSPGQLDPRNIPNDGVIAKCFYEISNPAWQWVYGVLATYGLRNHEVFRADFSELPVVKVLENTKTGSRDVFPCYPEWVDQFNLGDIQLPPIRLDRSNDKIGHSVTRYLSPLLSFQPYDLRHAWAIRTAVFGWPVELASRQMGHSVEMHTRTYHRWLTREHQQRVYDLLVNRSDRPLAPKHNPTTQTD